MIRYIPSNRSPILFLNEERLPRADLYIAPETYRPRQQLMRERFERWSPTPTTTTNAAARCWNPISASRRPRAVRGLRRVPRAQAGREGRPGRRSRRRTPLPMTTPSRRSSCNASPTPPPTRGAGRRHGLHARTAGRRTPDAARQGRDPNDAGRQARTFRRSRQPRPGKLVVRRARFVKINSVICGNFHRMTTCKQLHR